MLEVAEIPGAHEGDVRIERCLLDIKKIGTAGTLAEAWGLLPTEGQGIVLLSDRVVRYDPLAPQGLLVEADVVSGDGTTVLRMSGQSWRAWRWIEGTGQPHWFVERRFRSSEPAALPPDQVFRTYWALKEDNDIEVWHPVGSRFCGFREDKS